MMRYERLLDSALERRVWSYVFVASALSSLGSLVWGMVLVAVGWREASLDGVAILGFGVSIAVLLSGEYVVLAPGYFASRQPWRRMLITRCVAIGMGGIVGGVMGACAGATRVSTATQGHRMGVVLGGAAAGALRGLRRYSRASRAVRLALKEIQSIASVRGQAATLWCVPVTAVALGLSGASRTNAVVVYVASLHAWLAVDWATTLAGLGLESILLEALNFRIAARAFQPNFETSIQLLLAALELGDATLGSDQEIALRAVYAQADNRRAAEATRKFVDQQRPPSSLYGYGDASQLRGSEKFFGSFYAGGGEHDPFLDGSAADGSTPQWRREIDAQRSVLLRAATCSTNKMSWLSSPPALSLASGGLVLGDGKRTLATRLAKLLALEALASASGDAGLVLNGAAGDVVLARVLRSCLLVLDGLTMRADLCAGGTNFLTSNQALLLGGNSANSNIPSGGVVSARAAFFSSRFAVAPNKKGSNAAALAAAYSRMYFDEPSLVDSPWGAASSPRLTARLLDGRFELKDLRAILKQVYKALAADMIAIWTGKYLKPAPPPEEERSRILDQDLSPLEARAADAAIRAILNIFCPASTSSGSPKSNPRPRDRLPLILSSFIAVKRALAVDPLISLDATNTRSQCSPRIRLNQRLDFALDSILLKYASLLPSFAFSPLDTPVLQRRINALASAQRPIPPS